MLQNLGDDRWTQPLPFLVEQLERLPRGRALDMAMGQGRNAVYLARQGWTVDGVDRSPAAVQKAMALAGSLGVHVNGIVADLGTYEIRPGSYDLICAELCGWGHYKMAGKIHVLAQDEYERWLAEKRKALYATE